MKQHFRAAGHLFLQDWEDEIFPIPFGDLQVGQQVKFVGRYSDNNKETSSSRKDEWDPYITYAGIVNAPHINAESEEDTMKCIAFLLPKGGMTGGEPGARYYKIYCFLGDGELVSWASTANLFFRSIFITPDGKELKGL